ncbi:hypothetical protein quinque_015872, partial [Culex quinquefasciatus]
TCYEMERYLKDEPKLQTTFKKLPADLDTPWDLFATPGPISGWKVEVDSSYCLEELNLHDRHSSSSSPSSSSSSSSSSPCSTSWDSSPALSCAVVVKKERLDPEDEEDDGNNSDSCCDEPEPEQFSKISMHHLHHHHHHHPNAIELRLVARATTSDLLPTLTPPSSPESHLSKGSGSSTSNPLTTTTTLAATIKTEPEIALLEHQGGGILRVSTASGHIPRNAIVRLTTTSSSKGGHLGVTRVIQVSPQLQAAIAQRSASSLTERGDNSETPPAAARPQSRLQAADTQVSIPRLQEGLHEEFAPEGAPANAY